VRGSLGGLRPLTWEGCALLGGVCSGWGDGRGVGGKAQVFQDALNDVRLRYQGDDLAVRAACVTARDVETEHWAHQVCPCVLQAARRGRDPLAAGATRGRTGDDSVADRRTESQRTVVGDAVDAGLRVKEARRSMNASGSNRR
jgi:hypothetical protein